MEAKDIERFWSKVDKSGDCWLWQASKNVQGYGGISINGKWCRAHRVSYELANGGLPPNLCVLHICDNPPCVNPTHLRAGTHKDNVHDMWAKNRGTPLKGEKCGKSKLTWAAVREIRTRYAQHNITSTRLGAEFGVSQSLISYVLSGKIWKE